MKSIDRSETSDIKKNVHHCQVVMEKFSLRGTRMYGCKVCGKIQKAPWDFWDDVPKASSFDDLLTTEERSSAGKSLRDSRTRIEK